MFTTSRARCLWVLAACGLGACAADNGAAPQKSITVDLGGGVKMDLVPIPAGSFRMGSEKGSDEEKPVHEVKVPKPLYMGKHEVTQEQWEAVIGANPSKFKGAKNPVDSVSWNDCQAFLKKLGERVRGGKFALPTEAEWESACRAGSKTEFCFGDDEKQLREYAWYWDNSEKTPHPVGGKNPNAWGLFDMHGSVSVWCEDLWHDSYQGAPNDGSAWVVGGDHRVRVLRGGSWRGGPSYCRSAARFRVVPAIEGYGLGCRVVLRDF